MPTTTTPREKHTPAPNAARHRVPIGLHVAAIALDPHGCGNDFPHIMARLAHADSLAAALLADPMTDIEHGIDTALDTMEQANGAAGLRTRIAAAMSSIHDPEAVVFEFAQLCRMPALYLGLCIGYRLGARIESKGGAR